LHSTEIGASQFSMQFAYDLAFNQSKNTRAILSRTVCLLIPSSNPDGHDFVVNWYRETLGTEAEGTHPPGLYHKYAGHDNNRDWFMLNLQETRVVTEVLYKEWFPQVIFDMHEMGSEGPRLVIPPHFEVTNPLIDPIIHQELRHIGDYILDELTRQNVKGIAGNTVFDMWWHGGFRTAPYFHNMVGILSEVASARLATPDTIPQSNDFFVSKDIIAPDAVLQNTPKPWNGDVWRLADIVDIEQKSAYALLEIMARGRKDVLENFYRMGRRAIEKGMQDSCKAYVIPLDQHDSSSAKKLLEILMAQGIDVYRPERIDSEKPFTGIQGYYIPTAQPYRANILCLFEPLKYPETMMRPYDITAWTLPHQMGVHFEKATQIPEGLEPIVEHEIEWPVKNDLADDALYFALDPRSNDTYRVIQELLDFDINVSRISEKTTTLPDSVGAGWFLVEATNASQTTLARLLKTNCLNVVSINYLGEIKRESFRKSRLVLMETCAGNIDQGWTRYLLDTYKIPYTILRDCELEPESLVSKYDAVILPSVSAHTLLWGESGAQLNNNHKSGLGNEGLEQLQAFVRSGGTLITFGEAAKSMAALFRLNMKNIIHPFAGFSAPGSLLQISLKPEHPLCFGMPERTAIFYNNDPVFSVQDGDIIGKYDAQEPFISGYIKNSAILKENAAMVTSDYGKGKIILFGFRPQHRGQTFSTFKLIFNSVLSSVVTPHEPSYPLPAEE
ncbi:MAG: hypothetical protein DWQ10_17245, partial [Calditrichaeota bacterium]